MTGQRSLVFTLSDITDHTLQKLYKYINKQCQNRSSDNVICDSINYSLSKNDFESRLSANHTDYVKTSYTQCNKIINAGKQQTTLI